MVALWPQHVRNIDHEHWHGITGPRGAYVL